MVTNNDSHYSVKRSPYSVIYVGAGTSGIRHLFPIHLTDVDYTDDLFCRSISHLRFRTQKTKLCPNNETISSICSTIRTLERFDIGENELEHLPADICSLVNLQTLNCSRNKLTNISDAFEQLHKLKQLDLSFNQFKRVPAVIYKLKHLTELNIENNLIKTIDNDLLNLRHLKSLVLDHNQIQSLESLDFEEMKRLECIHIAHNQLTKFPRNLHKLTHLKYVNLSHNRLTYFPIELLLINTLDVLNLSHNNLTQLSTLTDIYKRTSLMFSIDLSFNQLNRFYDFLFLISLKLDLSNNKISSIPTDFIRLLNYDMITSRELKINNNPLKESTVISDIINEENTNPRNILEGLYTCYEKQKIDTTIRQGFKILITGCKKSGKSSLAKCLEEYRPLMEDEKQERFVNIIHFPFNINSDLLLETKSRPRPSQGSVDSMKIKQSLLDANTIQKERKPSYASARRSTIRASISSTSSLSPDLFKSLPLTVYDFNGSSEYYEYMLPFMDTNALQLICINAVEFQKKTPNNIEDVFSDDFDLTSYPNIAELFKILRILLEKVAKNNSILIIPIATCIDLYDKQSQQDKIETLEKINTFFQLYLEVRMNKIRHEIEKIDCLQTIPPVLSERLKTFTIQSNIQIQIEQCQPISSLTNLGMDELNRKIQQCILTQNHIFPNISRILPLLWADANQHIESLVDHLPVPYLSWEQFISHLVSKHALSDVMNDIVTSLAEQGRILVLRDIGTSNRIVFLRPLWLADLVSSLFQHDNFFEATYQSFVKEYHEHGRLHSNFVHSLWNNILHKKEHFYDVWNILMKYLLIAYPKVNKKQLKTFMNSENKNEVKFDHIIVPYHLPLVEMNEQENEKQRFYEQMPYVVSVCFQSSVLPVGLFDRYSVLALIKLDIIYGIHRKNFIVGEHKEKGVKFILETNNDAHYVRCYCGTDTTSKPFDNIWNVLLSMINLFEDLFKILAPKGHYNRLVVCPYCNEYTFMGEWITPKELQNLKVKACSSCNEEVDTLYLIQPNENKRRNENLLKKIRERKANDSRKGSAITTTTVADTTSGYTYVQ